MPVNYIPLNVGIDFGSDYLTNEVAYFLGGILAADESAIKNGIKYWIAPFRYNPTHITTTEMEKHFNHVCTIGQTLKCPVYMKDTVRQAGLDSGKFRHPGFGAFFTSSGCEDLTTILTDVRMALSRSSAEVRRCFIVGAFDGRCSVDVNSKTGKHRFISLDCPNDTTGAFIKEIFEAENFHPKFNYSRDRPQGGNPRKAQLRIKGADFVKFSQNYGLVSERKFNVLYSAYRTEFGECNICEDNSILNGLRTVR